MLICLLINRHMTRLSMVSAQDGSTPLHKAVSDDRSATAERLLDRGADMKAVNKVTGSLLLLWSPPSSLHTNYTLFCRMAKLH